MKRPIFLLAAAVTALALGCGSSDDPTAPGSGQLPDGPVVELITDKATVMPGDSVTAEVRAGIRKDGVVTYIENVEIYASLDNATAGSIEGFTDVDGRLAQTLTFDGDDENGIFIELRAEYPTGEEPERSFWIHRPNELKVIEQQTISQAGVLFRREGGASIIFREYLSSDSDDIGLFTPNHTTSHSGSSGSMSASASATMQGSIGVTGSASAPTFTYNITVDGEVSLSDPVTSGSYFAESSADAELDVEFVVWGAKEATMTIAGDIDMPHYEILFEGTPFDEDNFDDVEELICYRDADTTDPACPQINRTVKLKPGSYEICIEMEGSKNFKDEGPTEGRATYAGSADLTITLTQ